MPQWARSTLRLHCICHFNPGKSLLPAPVIACAAVRLPVRLRLCCVQDVLKKAHDGAKEKGGDAATRVADFQKRVAEKAAELRETDDGQGAAAAAAGYAAQRSSHDVAGDEQMLDEPAAEGAEQQGVDDAEEQAGSSVRASRRRKHSASRGGDVHVKMEQRELNASDADSETSEDESNAAVAAAAAAEGDAGARDSAASRGQVKDAGEGFAASAGGSTADEVEELEDEESGSEDEDASSDDMSE
jgi:hypothetical protein